MNIFEILMKFVNIFTLNAYKKQPCLYIFNIFELPSMKFIWNLGLHFQDFLLIERFFIEINF